MNKYHLVKLLEIILLFFESLKYRKIIFSVEILKEKNIL